MTARLRVEPYRTSGLRYALGDPRQAGGWRWLCRECSRVGYHQFDRWVGHGSWVVDPSHPWRRALAGAARHVAVVHPEERGAGMARSEAAWVVLDGGTREPVAAFTVRHELVTWLGRRPSLEGLEVWRCGDGLAQGAPRAVPLDELRARARPW